MNPEEQLGAANSCKLTILELGRGKKLQQRNTLLDTGSDQKEIGVRMRVARVVTGIDDITIIIGATRPDQTESLFLGFLVTGLEGNKLRPSIVVVGKFMLTK